MISIKLLAGLLFAAASVQAQNTEITVSNIRSTKGRIVIAIFKDEKAYKETKPFKTIPFEKKAISNGTLIVNCELEPGSYGITLLDDENGNGKLEKNMIGIPKEGFGFSNFYMEKMEAPLFSDFKTEIKNSGNKVPIKVKYM